MFFNKLSSSNRSLMGVASVIAMLLLPTSLAVPCRDDPEYTFGRQQEDSNGVISSRNCAWLNQAPDTERNKWCFGRRFHSHVRVVDKCQVTCGQCDAVRPGCVTYPTGWTDEIGDDCSFYEIKENCDLWGGGYANKQNGYTAQDSCCACGGGRIILN